MKLLNGHLNLTAKSVGAAIGGVATIATAFRWLTPAQAAAVATGVVPILAALVPDREQGAKP